MHTAGHSAGSIFHSHLIPEMLSAGVPSIASLNLLAPAIRVDEFKDRMMKKSVLDKIEQLAMFTMSEAFEKKDTCIGVYGKSLLYLIRAVPRGRAAGGDPRSPGVRTPRRRPRRPLRAPGIRRPRAR